MLSIKYNKENHPMLNWIYDILAELQIQGKQIIQCKIPIEVKENKVIVKAANHFIHIPGMNTTKLPYTDYSGELESSNGKGNGKQYWYTTTNHASKSGKVSTTDVGNTRSN